VIFDISETCREPSQATNVGSIPIARSIFPSGDLGLAVFGESEDVFETFFKKSCNPESKFKGR
jgi:hypothetical protein